MSQPYSQSKALWAITRASFKAIFAHPSAIIFSILFPIIFVLIFGAFGKGGVPVYRVAIAEGCDTTNVFFQSIQANPQIRIMYYPDTAARNKDLLKGRLSGVVCVNETKDSLGNSKFAVRVRSTTASNNTIEGLQGILEYEKVKYEVTKSGLPMDNVSIAKPDIETVRPYRQIDFVLPGQLGFSILFSTLFGVAFTFYGLREQLVLKRFYATPVKKISIL